MLPKRRADLRDLGRIIAIGLFILLLAVGLVSVNLLFVVKMSGGGEFLTVWSGARAFLFEHVSPYSTYVPDQVQKWVYERRAVSGENPFILDIPFNILLLFFPISLIQNPTAALGIFQSLLELAVLWLVILCMQVAHWNPKLHLQIPFFIFVVFNYFTITSLFEGSLSILVLAGIAGLLLSLRTGQEELAGALVALLLFKGQVTLPILVFVSLRVVRLRMWRAMAGFAMLSFVLGSLSYFLYPGWTIPYLRALVNDARIEYGYSTFSTFTQLLNIQDSRAAWIVVLMTAILIIFEWVRAQDANELQVTWTSSLTLAATPLLGFRFEIQELIILLLPLTLILAVTYERWIRTGRWTAIVFMIAFFSLSWVAFANQFLDRPINIDRQIFLAFPISIIIGLYWIRWWAIRPPRTWLDHISKPVN